MKSFTLTWSIKNRLLEPYKYSKSLINVKVWKNNRKRYFCGSLLIRKEWKVVEYLCKQMDRTEETLSPKEMFYITRHSRLSRPQVCRLLDVNSALRYAFVWYEIHFILCILSKRDSRTDIWREIGIIALELSDILCTETFKITSLCRVETTRGNCWLICLWFAYEMW